MLITKADGTVEEFKPDKLRASLGKAGAEDGVIERVVADITSHLTKGMTTAAIYRRAFRLLKKYTRPAAARYSLRRALFDLGPTGFPFEDFLGALFREEGYTVALRQTIEGKCATHEIDVVAHNDTDSLIVEAKFHQRPGLKSDLQDLLYSYARHLDLQQKPSCKEDRCGIDRLILATNTKFTHTAVRYAKCTGLSLLSWDYPKGAGLQKRVERVHLYPVTMLTRLSKAEKQRLVKAGIVLCRDLLAKPAVLQKHHVPQKKHEAVLAEARQLCSL